MEDLMKFFHKTPEIFTLKASRYGNLCTSAPSLAVLGIAGTSSALLSLARAVVNDHPTEVLLVDGLVCAESGSIVVIDRRLIAMRSVVCTEHTNANRCVGGNSL